MDTQRYINIKVFREMARVIEEWKEEERSRERAALLLFWGIAVAGVAVVALVRFYAVR